LLNEVVFLEEFLSVEELFLVEETLSRVFILLTNVCTKSEEVGGLVRKKICSIRLGVR